MITLQVASTILLPSDEVHWNPEPVCDGGPMALRDEFTSQASDRRKVKSNGGLENQERQERHDAKAWREKRLICQKCSL